MMLSLYTNGNLMGQNSSGSKAPDNPMSIGGRFNGSDKSLSRVAELIVFDRVLSTQKRQDIEEYLRSKCKLILNL